MIHTRIRRFNTRDTYPEQKLDNDLCQAVIAGKTIYLRGQCPQDLDTSVSVAVGDPAGQAEQVMEHICKVTVYLTDIRHRETIYRVLGRWMKGVFPVFTGLVVVALARPEWLVEVDVIAALPDE
jgi:enamine deaminase RidA (YjgF/YER057c/UK114 family)